MHRIARKTDGWD